MATYKKITLPDNLHPQALKFVKGIVNTFDEENKLNSLDEMVFFTLASWLSTFIKCSERVDAEGMVVTTPRGIQQISPYAVQMKVAQSHLNTLAKEMGLSLGSRGKIKAVANITEESPLAAFLKVTIQPIEYNRANSNEIDDNLLNIIKIIAILFAYVR